MTSDVVSTLDGIEEKRSDVWCRLSQRTGAVLQVKLLIGGKWSLIRLIEVIEVDVGVRNDQISVAMILKVLAHREVDPLLRVDESGTVRAGVDNGELVSWANTATEENPRAAKGTGRQNDAARGSDIDNTRITTIGIGRNLDTSDVTVRANDTPDISVQNELEVAPGAGSDQVCGHRAITLAIPEHERWVSEDLALLVVLLISRHILPSGSGERSTECVVAFWEIEFAVL